MKRKTSIIIVTYNHLAYTKDCIESIRKYTKKEDYELILIDNASKDETRNWLIEQPDLKIILNAQNIGFPKACNQGIKLANPDNDILLLNNDTIVTTNWLDNLKICLESDEHIGAVGAICNHNENLQGCSFEYDDFDTMQQLAKENNISNASRWEEKMFLIGFCLLINKEALDRVGLLDEEYTPGYIEDNDFSLRLIEAGYRLMLCHDCFIHHYLGSSFRKDLSKFYPILDKNRTYFIKKWGFHPFAFDEIKDASMKLIDNVSNILDMHCGIGVNLLKFIYQFPNIKITGYEPDLNKASFAKHITTVFSNLEDIPKETYDCICIGTFLEIEKAPKQFLELLKQYLIPGGYIIGEIHNAASLFNIKSLLEGTWYYRGLKQINDLTIEDIFKMFKDAGYQNGYTFSWYQNLSQEEETIVTALKSIHDKDYCTTYYTFRFQKS